MNPNKAIGHDIGSRVWKKIAVKKRLDVFVKKLAMLSTGPSQSLNKDVIPDYNLTSLLGFKS